MQQDSSKVLSTDADGAALPDPVVAVVVPVRNEADNILPLVGEIDRALGGRWPYEIIYVDDGSDDATPALLREARQRFAALRVVRHRSSCGQSQAVATGVKRGEGIANPLRKCGEFPPLAAHLLAVGEETGRLDQMFSRMAEIYETDTRAAIRRFTAIFEPAVILIMGILIGSLILSMLLAITSINDVAM